jgi:hypothetical protein
VKIAAVFYNVLGVQVCQTVLSVTGNVGRVTVPATLGPGLYFIKLQEVGSGKRYSGTETIFVK